MTTSAKISIEDREYKSWSLEHDLYTNIDPIYMKLFHGDVITQKNNDIVVVVQGDEPLVHPDMIDLAVQPLLDEKDIFVSNLCAELLEKEWEDPGEIKVVCDLQMNAMYMSRSPIPSTIHEEKRTTWWKQVCIMPFRWHFMKKFNH